MKANRTSGSNSLLSEIKPTPSRETGRPRTRKPASPRVRVAQAAEASDSGQAPRSHTAPLLTERLGLPSTALHGVDLLVEAIGESIRSKNWDRPDGLLATMRENSLRFDGAELRERPAVKALVRTAPAAVLDAGGTVEDFQVLLALDLLVQGCDWNAGYREGVTLLDHIRQLMTPDLQEAVREYLPELRYLLRIPPE